MQLPPDIADSFLDTRSELLPSLDEESAKKLVREYLETTDSSLVNDHFIVHSDEKRVIPALAELTSSEGPVTQLKWMGQVYSNNRVHDQVVVFREKEGEQKNRIALLFKGDDGTWRIDFDAYMRTSTPSWEDILSRNSETSVVRVFIGRYNYYNGIYSDDQIWQAYSIISPDVPEIIYGYVKKDSIQEIALSRIISAGREAPRTVLGLLSKDDAGERQFEISRVYAEDWALAPEAYDESF
ncbi:MAG: hypothetical protein NWQ16_08590 [Akkermansiaceae bacterium]|nr:hypothetical protein [Akkermansiaceae bacterium]